MHTHKQILRWCHTYGIDTAALLTAIVTCIALQWNGSALIGYLPDRLPGETPAPHKVVEEIKKVTSTTEQETRSERLRRRLLRRFSLREFLFPIFSLQENSPNTLHFGPSAGLDAWDTQMMAIGTEDDGPFPPFVRTVHPVSRVPNWGAMTTPEQWNRTHAELSAGDFVPVPAYDIGKLQVPLQDLVHPRNIEEITRKLYYSTRYFGSYDIDTGEFTGKHPGIDLKLAFGAPFSAIAGGRVYDVREDDVLGLHIIIEHRHPRDGTFFSVYAHLDSVSVNPGDDVLPGTTIGTVGLTGRTSGPHIHLQVDLPSGKPHMPYAPTTAPSAIEAARHAVNPIEFIQRYAAGE